MTPEQEARNIQRLEQVRNQIFSLRKTYGDCLNAWPLEAKKRFGQLNREKTEREGTVYKLKMIK